MKVNRLRKMYSVFALFLVTTFELASCSQPYFQHIDKGIERSRLGRLCGENSDCEFVNSACMEDRCGCVQGFERSLYHEEDTCVPGTLYLTTNYHLNSLHWTDTLRNKESKDYEALVNHLETEMRTNTGDLFIDLPEADFSPSDDEKVVANLRYHMKNPMVIKANRLTRETHNRHRRQDEEPDFLTELLENIEAAAADEGITAEASGSVQNGPLGKYCNGDCGITHSECVSSTCRCIEGYVHLDGDDDTCHPSVDLNGDCIATGECGDNQICDGDSVCSCEEGAVEISDGTECGHTVGLDGPCTDDDQCKKLGSACIGTCVCVSGDRDGDRCSDAPTTTEPPPTTTPECGTVLGASCDAECPCIVTDSICSENVCACDSTKVDVDGICKQRANLGEACEDTLQCPELSICPASVCVCSDVAVDITGEGCVALADLGSACTYNQQCTTNAECDSGTSLCTCLDTFAFSYANENTCVPEEFTLNLEFAYNDWDANMATVGSTEYNAQKTALETLLTDVEPLFLRLENLVITDDGGKAFNVFEGVFTNEDTVAPSRVRREVKGSLETKLMKLANDNNQPISKLQITRK